MGTKLQREARIFRYTTSRLQLADMHHLAALAVFVALCAGPASAHTAAPGEVTLAWTCRYSEPSSHEPLHLKCRAQGEPSVVIPIWAPDYGDGMVEQLMRSALCRRALQPCAIHLEHAGAAQDAR